MKAFLRLLLASGAFLAVVLTSTVLIALEVIAKPLRFANVRCLAALEAIHAKDGPGAGDSSL